MTSTRLIGFTALAILFLYGCKEDIAEKYQRPDWLAGKVYTQVKDDPTLSTFAKCIELTGFDTIIDVAGSYTVFAPSNDAFTEYFQTNPKYNSVEDIPLDELTRIVKYHIVQSPWTKQQIQSLDVFGWIDTSDITNNRPGGNKRETLLLDKNIKYGIERDITGNIIIKDTLQSSWFRRVITNSRKHAPFFYKEYFSIYSLKGSDYEFYFDRPFSDNEIHYVGALIVGNEIFAENGFVYRIDKVVEPLKNAYQILNDDNDEIDYSDFLELINLFPQFEYNEDKTFEQPGADQGLQVDSLFDLNFPQLTFDIADERTSAPRGTEGLPDNVTIRYHHGMMAPNNEAFNNFINEYFTGSGRWGDIKSAPVNIKRIIANTHLSAGTLYPSDFETGFYNGEEDIVYINEEDIIQKQYASNCTFFGLSKMIVPRAFKSVTGPVYLSKGYANVMYAIEQSGLLAALKRENRDYQFFVESDINSRLDSSFLYNPITLSDNQRFSAYTIAGSSATRFFFSTNDLRNMLLNHIGTESPTRIPRKEFIRNLAGNFIIFNNETGEVRGTAPTTRGYKGSTVQDIPRESDFQSDNGKFYDIDNWYSFSSPTLFIKIQAEFPEFHALLKKAGLTRDAEFRYTFISNTDNYTAFIPNAAALLDYQADTLNNVDLKNFLLMHFVQGDMIFTDGKKSVGYYETARPADGSNEINKSFTKIYIQPGIDVISIKDNSAGTYLEINESVSTNQMTGRNLATSQETFPSVITTGVVHEINKVLVYTQLDTQ